MKNIIEIRDFSFSYPESGKKTLKHINMAIQEGRNWVTQLMEETGYPTEKMPQKKVFRWLSEERPDGSVADIWKI